LPFSLSLKNSVNTGVSFDTPSGAIAQAQRWAAAGFRGYGPTRTFPGAGMDGMGCGCGCGGGCNGSGGNSGVLLLVVALAVFLCMGNRGMEL
jgi:hypothetical protein